MFDFSSGELLLIAVAILVFVKPKDLPAVLRTIGQWTGKIRRMAGEFQDQFREAMREAEMADLKKDIDEAASKFTAGADPFTDIQRSVEWKPPEPASTNAAGTPLPADAPPAPPAEAIVPEPAPGQPAAEPPAAVPVPEAVPEPAVAQGDLGPPPAGGDRAA
jgi:sec-independent protein translocase protein TatB